MEFNGKQINKKHLKEFINKTKKGQFTLRRGEIYTIIMNLINLGYKINSDNIEKVVRKIEIIRILNTTDMHDTSLPEMEEIEQGMLEIGVKREDVIVFEGKVYNYTDLTNIMDSVLSGKKSSDILHYFIRRMKEAGFEVNLKNLKSLVNKYEEAKASNEKSTKEAVR